MSNTIDERVVILEFNNGQFEAGVQQSVTTLQRLKGALNLEGSVKGLNNLQKAGSSFNMNNVADNVEKVANRFSTLGIIGDQVIRRLTNSAINLGQKLITAVPNQILTGGKKRSQNIEHAQFMMQGLLKDAYDWEKIKEDLNYGVDKTPYGLDEAASVASQLVASNVAFGEDMKAALRGISGVASMTASSYADIGNIFTKIAGQGKVMTQELNQFAARGLNVAATMAEALSDVDQGIVLTEADIRELVHKGEIDFMTFAYAMDQAFGEQATKANETFTGALSNVKASLSRIGEMFATPSYENLRRILVELIPLFNAVKKQLEPVAALFTGITTVISDNLIVAIKALTATIQGAGNIWQTFAAMFGNGPFGIIFDGLAAGAGSIEEAAKYWKSRNFFRDIDPFEELKKGFSKGVSDISTQLNKDYTKLSGEVTEKNPTGAVSPNKLISGMYANVKAEAKALTSAYDLMNETYFALNEEGNEYVKNGHSEVVVNEQKAKALKELVPALKDVVTSTSIYDAQFGEDDPFTKVFNTAKDAVNTIKELQTENPFELIYGNFATGMTKITKDIDQSQAKLVESTKELGLFGKMSYFVSDGAFVNAKNRAAGVQKAYDLYNETLFALNEETKNYVKEGKSELALNAAKQQVLGNMGKAMKHFADSTHFVNVEYSKQSKAEKIRNDLLKKGQNLANSFGKSMLKVLGLETETTTALGENVDVQTAITNLANEVISGKYGNGQKRIEELGKLGAAYSIVQNKVNELENCEKRHEVTAEDEAAMMKYLSETLGINFEQASVVNDVFTKMGDIFAGLIAAFNLIREVGAAIFAELIQPFLAFAIPRLLQLILTPLSAIGNALTELYSNIGGEGIATYFSNLREKIVAFWESAKELEGVKALSTAFTNLKTVLSDLWNKGTQKVQEGFEKLNESFNLPNGEFFLNLLNNITTGLSGFVDFVTTHLSGLGDFFAPVFDWLVALPGKFSEFWESINGFEGIKAYFKPITDWFDGVGKTLKSFWYTLTGQEEEPTNPILKAFHKVDKLKKQAKEIFGGKQEPQGIFAPLIKGFQDLRGKLGAFFEEAMQFDNIKDLFDWLKTKAADAITNLWNSLTTLDGLQVTFSPVIDVFNNLKDAVMDFVDSNPQLKSIKDSIVGFFDENLVQTITDIKDAIVEFFTSIFGPQEENEGEAEQFQSITDRIITAAQTLKDRLVEIFTGENFDLGKLLTLGGIGTGAVTLLSLLLGSGGKGGGIAGAIYGGKSGITLPKVTAGLIAFAAAMNLFGSSTKKAGEEADKSKNPIAKIADTVHQTRKDIKKKITGQDDGNVFTYFWNLLFGENFNRGVETIKKTAGDLLGGVLDFIGGIFTGNGTGQKFGLMNAAKLLGGGVLLYGIVKFFLGIGAAIKTFFSLAKGGIPLLGDISAAIKAYTRDVQSNTLLKIAEVIGIFAASLIGLTLVDASALYNVAGVVAALMFVVTACLGILQFIKYKFGGKKGESVVDGPMSVIKSIVSSFAEAFEDAAKLAGIGIMFAGMAAAIYIIVKAIDMLSGMDRNALYAGAAIGAILLILEMVSTRLGEIEDFNADAVNSIWQIAKSILVVAAAISAIALLSSAGADFGAAFIAMAGMVALISFLVTISQGGSSEGLEGIAKTLYALSGSLAIFAVGAMLLALVPWPALGKGLAIFAVGLGALLGVSALLGKFATLTAGFKTLTTLFALGKSFAAFSAGLILLVGAIALMGALPWDVMVRGVGGFVAVLFAMVGAMAVFDSLHLSFVIIQFCNLLWKFALGALALGVALPILGQGLAMLGQIIITNFIPSLVGFGAMIGMIWLLGKVSVAVTPQVLPLGLAILAICAGIALVIGMITGFKAFGDLFTNMWEGIKGAVVGTGEAIKGFGGIAKGLFSGLEKEAKKKSFQTALSVYGVELNKMSFLNADTKKQLGNKMAELKTLDGSEYSVGLENVMAYIYSLNLPKEQTFKLVATTVETAVRDAQENYTLAIEDLKTKVATVNMSDEDSADFWKMVEDLINSGYDPSRDPIAIAAENIRFTIQKEGEEAGLEQGEIDDIAQMAVDAAVAASDHQIDLNNLELTIQNLTTKDGVALSDDAKTSIQTQITTALQSEPFTAKALIETISALISEDAVQINKKDRVNLMTAVTKAIKSGQEYSFTISSITAKLSNEYGLDTELVTNKLMPDIQTAIDAAATSLANGQPVTKTLDNIKVLLTENGVDDDAVIKQIQKSVLTAAIKKNNMLAAVGGVKILAKQYGLQNADEIGTKLTEWANTNPVEASAELTKLLVTFKEHEISPEEVNAIIEDIQTSVSSGVEANVSLSNLHVELEKQGLSGEVETQISGLVEEIQNGGGISKKPIEYQQLVRLVLKSSTDENGNLDKEKAGGIMQSINNALKQGRDVTTARLKKMLITVEQAEFATDSAKTDWYDKVKNLLTIKETDPLNLPVALKDFILGLDNSSIDQASKDIIKQTAEDILNSWETSYNTAYADVLERVKQKRRELMGGLGAVDTESGVYVYKDNPLMKAIKEFWSADKLEGSAEEIQANWTEFANKLSELGFTEADFYNFVGADGDVDITEIIRNMFKYGDEYGPAASYLQELLEGVIRSAVTGASERAKHEYRTEGILDFSDLINPNAKTDKEFLNAEEASRNFVRSLSEAGLLEKVREQLGKGEGDQLTPAEIITSLINFDSETGEVDFANMEDFDALWEVAPAMVNQLLLMAQQAYDQAKEDAEGSEIDIYQWLTDYFTPKEINKETPADGVSESLQSTYDSLRESQKTFLTQMEQLWQPKNGEKTGAAYMEWLDGLLKDLDEGEGKIDLSTIMEKVLRGDAGGQPFDAVGYLHDYIMNRIQEGGGEVNYGNLYKEFPDLFADWLILTPDQEAELQEKASKSYEHVIDVNSVEKAVAEAVEKESKGDNSGWEAILGGVLSGDGSDALSTLLSGGLEGVDVASLLGDSEIGSGLLSALLPDGTFDMDQIQPLLDSLGLNLVQGAANSVTDNQSQFCDATGGMMDAGLEEMNARADIASPSKKTYETGEFLVLGLVNGIADTTNWATAAITQLAKACLQAFEEKFNEFLRVGTDTIANYISGMSSKLSDAYSAAADIANSAKSGVEDNVSGMESTGRYFGEGFVTGVSAKVDDAYNAGYELGKAATRGTADATATASPSKEAKKLGNYFGMGYAIGIEMLGKRVHDAAGGMAEGAVDALTDPLKIVQEILSDDVDIDPVITPVMDLSQIQNGVKRINRIAPSMGVDLGLINASIDANKLTANADVISAISDLSKGMTNTPKGDTYNINGITYDDGSNITSAVQTLIHAAKVERRR